VGRVIYPYTRSRSGRHGHIGGDGSGHRPKGLATTDDQRAAEACLGFRMDECGKQRKWIFLLVG
jgi:hypothetical protein